MGWKTNVTKKNLFCKPFTLVLLFEKVFEFVKFPAKICSLEQKTTLDKQKPGKDTIVGFWHAFFVLNCWSRKTCVKVENGNYLVFTNRTLVVVRVFVHFAKLEKTTTNLGKTFEKSGKNKIKLTNVFCTEISALNDAKNWCVVFRPQKKHTYFYDMNSF